MGGCGDVEKGRLPAREHFGAGRAAKSGRPSQARGNDAGFFVGWFPLFPLSHMQISAPGPAGGAARASRSALEGKCGSCRGLGEPVIQVFAYGDPRGLISLCNISFVRALLTYLIN